MTTPAEMACPRCSAAQGETCSSVGPDAYARGAPLRRAHPERYAAARERTAINQLSAAVAYVNEHHPLPRCTHGNALRDGGGDILEPSCGCRAWGAGWRAHETTCGTLGIEATTERLVEGVVMPLCAEHAAELDADVAAESAS